MLYGTGGAHTQENVTATIAAVALAVSKDVGFPGIDGANHYHNQDGVAKGIALSGTPREKLWMQTKIEPCGHSIVRHGHCYEDSLAAFTQNLEQLNTSYVDMTLIHSPPCVPNSTWADAACVWDDEDIYPQHCNCASSEPCSMMQQQWAALELMLAQGRTRAIGVSNFCAPCLDCLAKVSTTVPAVNQLQFHAGMPGADPEGLVGASQARGIVAQAYSPLAGEQAGALLGDPAMKAIGAAHNISSAQVALRWVLQLGVALTTATASEDHMVDDVSAWTPGAQGQLTDAEMAQITALSVAPDDPVKAMCLFQ
jgi:diketogulonate reductase-like aldo/keto reductase